MISIYSNKIPILWRVILVGGEILFPYSGQNFSFFKLGKYHDDIFKHNLHISRCCQKFAFFSCIDLDWKLIPAAKSLTKAFESTK